MCGSFDGDGENDYRLPDGSSVSKEVGVVGWIESDVGVKQSEWIEVEVILRRGIAGLHRHVSLDWQ